MKFSDKVGIVTGGAQGIGKAIAKKFLLEGATVIIVDVDQEAGIETRQEFQGLGSIEFMMADVADETSVDSVVATTLKKFRQLDFLINNTGVMLVKPLEQLSLQEWNQIIGINLTAAFLFAKYSIPHLRQRKGSIVNISSTRAFMSEPNTESYAASKGGLFALTHALAISLGPDIRVNCINPGWIETSEWKKSKLRHSPNHTVADLNQHPVGRVGIPEDIAECVAYLVAPEAGFITGQSFTIDGGMTKKMIYV